MKAKIIQIGNSRGLRLNKTILEKYDINDLVEIVLKENHIELKPIKNPRLGWDEEFKRMNELGDDQLLIQDSFADEEIEEWT